MFVYSKREAISVMREPFLCGLNSPRGFMRAKELPLLLPARVSRLSGSCTKGVVVGAGGHKKFFALHTINEVSRASTFENFKYDSKSAVEKFFSKMYFL